VPKLTRKRSRSQSEGDLFGVEALRTAPCVPAIHEAVATWAAGGYKGTTETTQLLLNYWFKTDHRLPNGQPFKYHTSQQAAIESLIFVWEFEKVRTRKTLLERYAQNLRGIRLPPYDEFARYCIKMATGSGKTKVMSLVVAWQFLNAIREHEELAKDYATTFLLIAPNVIVLERLKSDFTSGRIFKVDPIIPKELEIFWDLDCVMRGEGERPHSEGALFLTNIQQFYDRPQRQDTAEPDELSAVLGSKPPAKKLELTDFSDRIKLRAGHLVVINDEAHHTHDEDSEWNKVIRRLHTETPLTMQVDFSATPRYQKGQLFPWTLCDYPIKQAILDEIVKRPIKGIARIDEAKSQVTATRYQGFLVAGVERWREYRQQLAPFDKRPILFIMMNDTEEADDVGEWLRTKYPKEFGSDKTLVIHTDNTGEVSKSDLEEARRIARQVDEGTSPVSAIVSVLMLREGWDVQNVTVVVGLRPYTSKANILPEQTIGRGLRLMFRGETVGYQERVDVIGNRAFISFVEELEKLEDMKLETFEVGKDKLKIVMIAPEEKKVAHDIGLPLLTPILVRKKSLAQEIADLEVGKLPAPVLPLRKGDDAEKSFTYEGHDILTLQKLFEREYAIPEPQTGQEVIGYYARLIAQEVRLPSQFAALYPKVREYFEHKAFGKTVNLDDPTIIKAMSTNVAQYVCVQTFKKELLSKTIAEQQPKLEEADRRLSALVAFPWSRPVHEGRKTIFNLVPCDNEFEKEFAKFLDQAEDVRSFAKLPASFGFAIEYTDGNYNLRYYYPDFVAVDADGTHWLIETKGMESEETAYKDQAAAHWCENATALTRKSWRYKKVSQQKFKELQPSSLADLGVL